MLSSGIAPSLLLTQPRSIAVRQELSGSTPWAEIDASGVWVLVFCFAWFIEAGIDLSSSWWGLGEE
jgi:hypothetical protein